MAILVTGAAGFIGFHTTLALLAHGARVIGIDNLNSYYEVGLKQARLERLEGRPGFVFRRLDVSDRDAVQGLAEDAAVLGGEDITGIVHLAAQPGVRYSLVDPYVYVTANVMGQVVMLEMARRLPRLTHFVYASSSSVYGGNTRLPFSVEDRVDTPVSLYAATKRADELIAHTYAHTYGVPATALRYFTVYGPWGRPDMATWTFTRQILAGEPLRLFNHGDMERDFTYIDDIVRGTLAALDRPPPRDSGGGAPHRIYNLGNNRPEPLHRFIAILEGLLGVRATVVLEPNQPGEVTRTFADIAAAQRDLGFQPVTPIETGLARFVEWYRAYHGI